MGNRGQGAPGSEKLLYLEEGKIREGNRLRREPVGSRGKDGRGYSNGAKPGGVGPGAPSTILVDQPIGHSLSLFALRAMDLAACVIELTLLNALYGHLAAWEQLTHEQFGLASASGRVSLE